MLKKITIILLGLFLLSGCNGFRGYFKKSANNQYIDMKGFAGSKRKPLYNKKYIDLAKRNIIEENLDEDEEDDIDDNIAELKNPVRENHRTYMEMIKNDVKRNKLKKNNTSYRKTAISPKNGKYPSLAEANEKITKEDSKDQDLQQEIAEIKSMLNETKKDLVKYRCPMQINVEEAKPHDTAQNPEHINNPSSNRETTKRVSKNPRPL
jgi:hypothetical protein